MNVAVLHDEVERLKAELAQTQEALAQSEEARRRLESIVSDFQREKFGARSNRSASQSRSFHRDAMAEWQTAVLQRP